VLRPPMWARAAPTDKWSPPRPDAYPRYAGFLHALAQRYPRITEWQVWNEPSAPYFWTIQPGIPAYAALLKQAAAAIRSANPRARVILAGLSDRSWTALAALYRLGVRRSFDAVALNPFSSKVNDVVAVLERNRRVMAANGDARKPLLVTETTWPSAWGQVKTPYGYEETESGQALKLRRAMLAYARERRRLRIAQVFWYTWMSGDSNPDYPFDWSGLRRFDGARTSSKPALGAFRRVARRLER
jgi:polysaccharide biosynthesis protein PslG